MSTDWFYRLQAMTDATPTTEVHVVYPDGPPCTPSCPGPWSEYHDGYAWGFEHGQAEARAQADASLLALREALEQARAAQVADSHIGGGTFTDGRTCPGCASVTEIDTILRDLPAAAQERDEGLVGRWREALLEVVEQWDTYGAGPGVSAALAHARSLLNAAQRESLGDMTKRLGLAEIPNSQDAIDRETGAYGERFAAQRESEK